jgi:aminopeptidase YwaD
MHTLCVEIQERCVGSDGNRQAAAFFRDKLAALGWKTETQEFNAVDWQDGGAALRAGNRDFRVLVSPYSRGCSETAPLTAAADTAELEQGDFRDTLLLLHGELAKEQLMPKNFVFYNPDEHRKIISLLEQSGAKALICATGRNASLAGGVYPFPLIEDGDFDVPSVYMTEEEGKKLLPYVGKPAALDSISTRIPGTGCNIIGKKGRDGLRRIVVTAHIDAKKGTPGAIDNATGAVTLLILAGLLQDYSGDTQIEIAALNGEDYYAVPGQMQYIAANEGRFDSIAVNINIDGAGYKTGKSFFSFFSLPPDMYAKAAETMTDYPEITEGPLWSQGDHSIFIQYGRPAIAVSSQWFIENIDSQDITHTPKDSLEIVDCGKIVEIAEALNSLLRKL